MSENRKPEQGVKLRGAEKVARIPVKVVPTVETPRKPDWIRVKMAAPEEVQRIKTTLRQQKLHTVCEEAACPNLPECFGGGTATFMIMGDICTRRCPFCDVAHGRPNALDATQVARARGHQFDDRVFLVQRHQGFAQLVIGCMQRDGQRDIALHRKTVDLRHQARGGQGHPLVGQAVAEVVAHDAHRADHVVEVRQRLAHAHHHHVGELALLVRDVAAVARRDPHLADDFRGG